MTITEIRDLIKLNNDTNDVKNVIVDEKRGCVTATVNGNICMDCGWLEDFPRNDEYHKAVASSLAWSNNKYINKEL